MEPNETPSPEQKQILFRKPLNMVAYFVLDRAVSDMNVAAQQMRVVSMPEIAAEMAKRATAIAAERDEVLRSDQTTIVLANANEMPSSSRLQ